MKNKTKPLAIAFITGTRAEFGLTVPVLRAIQSKKTLKLQIIATGMHLDRTRGYSLEQIKKEGFTVDATVPWQGGNYAHSTGQAIAQLAKTLQKLQPDIVLVVGDRVEAFAGAVAGHLSGIRVAQIHGGDRALGQSDDSLRHAITKLAHLHFPATKQSAQRIKKLGENPRWIFNAGSPGNDGIADQACSWDQIQNRYPTLQKRQYALILYHPTDADESLEHKRIRLILKTANQSGFSPLIALYPNTDPGAAGIIRELQVPPTPSLAEAGSRKQRSSADEGVGRTLNLILEKNLPRNLFLGLMKHAGALIGNSSAGIIESAALGTWTLDIGPRQSGREHSANLLHADFNENQILAHLKKIRSKKSPYKGKNVYGQGNAGSKIAATLEKLANKLPPINKLIMY